MRTSLSSSRLSFVAALLAAASVTACGSSTTLQDHGSTSSSSTGGSGGGSGGGGDGGGAVSVSCSWAKNDSSDVTCASGPCTVAVDETLRCDDLELGAPGIRVAVTPTETWLATTSTNDVEVYSLANGVETREPVTHDLARAILTLATTANGDVELAGDPDSSTVFDFKGTLFTTRAGDAWTTQTLNPDTHHYTGLIDINAAADGTPHVALYGYDDNGPSYIVDATANGSAWSYPKLAAPANTEISDWNRVALGSDGTPVVLALALGGDSGGYTLEAHMKGSDATLGSFSSTQYPSYEITAPMQPSSAAANALFDAVYAGDDALHAVRVPSSGAPIAEAIPNTPQPVDNCVPPFNLAECQGTCASDYHGVQQSAYAIAWTDDGTAWVGYVDTHYTATVTWSPEVIGDGGMSCGGSGYGEGASTFHLLRLALDGVTPAAEVMSMPVGVLGTDDLFSDDGTDARAVDVRAFGKDLAIGFRTGSIGDPHTIRVLRLDTSTLM